MLDAGRTAYFFYDDAGMVTKRLAPVIFSNSLMTYMSYDDAGRLKQQEGYAHLSGVTDLITYFSYQRNPNGQPTWIRNEGDESTYYEYDALDRLTLEERKSSSATLYGFRYDFDAASNRTRKVTIHESDARTYFTYDARNLLDREWVDGGEAAYYTHDAAQRMKRREVTGTGQSAYFTHDQRQQVTRIDFTKASSADSPATFAYSGTGEAVIAGDNGETTYWQHDGHRLALERLDSTKSAVRRYRNNGPLVEYEEGGGPFQLAFDGEGAVRKGVSPLEGYVPGNFLTSKFGVPLIQTDTLRDGRVKWGGSGVLKLNALNETIYLLGAGGCFLPGPGRITIPPLGGPPGRGFGWHNQVSMVDGGGGLWTGVQAQDRPGHDDPPPPMDDLDFPEEPQIAEDPHVDHRTYLAIPRRRGKRCCPTRFETPPAVVATDMRSGSTPAGNPTRRFVPVPGAFHISAEFSNEGDCSCQCCQYRQFVNTVDRTETDLTTGVSVKMRSIIGYEPSRIPGLPPSNVYAPFDTWREDTRELEERPGAQIAFGYKPSRSRLIDERYSDDECGYTMSDPAYVEVAWKRSKVHAESRFVGVIIDVCRPAAPLGGTLVAAREWRWAFTAWLRVS